MGLIALTGSLYGPIPNLILNVGEQQAEEEFKWWVDTFKENFYVELNRHNLDEEEHVNRILIKFAKKYNVDIIVSNDVYYLNKYDVNAQVMFTMCKGCGAPINTSNKR